LGNNYNFTKTGESLSGWKQFQKGRIERCCLFTEKKTKTNVQVKLRQFKENISYIN